MTGDADCSISFKRCFWGFCYRKQVRLGEVGLGGLFETTIYERGIFRRRLFFLFSFYFPQRDLVHEIVHVFCLFVPVTVHKYMRGN